MKPTEQDKNSLYLINTDWEVDKTHIGYMCMEEYLNKQASIPFALQEKRTYFRMAVATMKSLGASCPITYRGKELNMMSYRKPEDAIENLIQRIHAIDDWVSRAMELSGFTDKERYLILRNCKDINEKIAKILPRWPK